MGNHGSDHADLLVIFGITGDLARKMTFRSLYRLERRELLDCPVIGVASDMIPAGQLVKHAREAVLGSVHVLLSGQPARCPVSSCPPRFRP